VQNSDLVFFVLGIGMKMGEKEKIEFADKSGDRGYFAMVPHIVRAKVDDPYQYTLWGACKELCGEPNHPLDWGIRQLADYAMMSVGKASQARQALAEKGLIELETYRDGNNRVAYRITIPDLWPKNIKWAREHPSPSSRLEEKREQKQQRKAKKQTLHDDQPTTSDDHRSCGEPSTIVHVVNDTVHVVNDERQNHRSPHERSLYIRTPNNNNSNNGDFAFGTFDDYAKSRGRRNGAMVSGNIDGVTAADRTEAANVILEWARLSAIVETDGRDADRVLRDAHESAHALFSMGLSVNGIEKLCEMWTMDMPDDWTPTIGQLAKYGSQQITKWGIRDGHVDRNSGSTGNAIGDATAISRRATDYYQDMLAVPGGDIDF